MWWLLVKRSAGGQLKSFTSVINWIGHWMPVLFHVKGVWVAYPEEPFVFKLDLNCCRVCMHGSPGLACFHVIPPRCAKYYRSGFHLRSLYIIAVLSWVSQIWNEKLPAQINESSVSDLANNSSKNNCGLLMCSPFLSSVAQNLFCHRSV